MGTRRCSQLLSKGEMAIFFNASQPSWSNGKEPTLSGYTLEVTLMMTVKTSISGTRNLYSPRRIWRLLRSKSRQRTWSPFQEITASSSLSQTGSSKTSAYGYRHDLQRPRVMRTRLVKLKPRIMLTRTYNTSWSARENCPSTKKL